MPVTDLIRALGYKDSPNFIHGSALEAIPAYSYVFRRAQSTCQLRGVYTLSEMARGGGTVVPLVYVCEATDKDSPPVIHQRVWNQNVVPFILVEKHGNVYLYSGFRYDGPPEKEAEEVPTTGVLRAVKEFNRNMLALQSFRAEAIDEGVVWQEWETHVDPRTRVDWLLLEQLKRLDSWLRGNHLKKGPAHALIGKYVFLRYLKDRNILSANKFDEWSIDPETVFGRKATLSGFGNVVKRLDAWLNGSIFPLDLKGKDAPSSEHLQRVAGVFNGDDPITGQLHLDFQPYDFSHIPVETLSVIYEQFLHAEGLGQDSGAYYTPVPLIDFMLQELEDHAPLRATTRVFDPACGSGAFLVQCYRRLVEQHLRKTGGERPKPRDLGELLVRNVYGIDRNEDACRVAELSLILTMLDYIEPPDLSTNPDFKIPNLHNVNIFHGDFFAPDCHFSPQSEAGKFDWIVGNPPWVEVDKKREDDLNVLRWMETHSKDSPTGGNQAAEAFAWRVADNLADGGVVGLLLPAMTLFKNESVAFRRQFFRSLNVWCVANFANLAEVLFAKRSRVPTAAFFYGLRDGGNVQNAAEGILTFAPFVANQEANRPVGSKTKDTWNIVVNASEIQNVSAELAANGAQLSWKAAMWGSVRDQKFITAVSSRFPRLDLFADSHQLHIHEGFQLRGEDEPGAEFIKELIGKNLLKMKRLRNCGMIFSFQKEVLEPVGKNRAYTRKGRGKLPLLVSRPPHVIVDEARRFAVFSDQFIAVPARQIGIAGPQSHAEILKAISLFLISDFSKYFQFFGSSQWGVTRKIATLSALKELPIPFDGSSAGELRKWNKLHAELVKQSRPRTLFSNRSGRGRTLKDLLREVNDRTFDILKIGRSERWLVEDLMNVRMPLDQGQLGREAVDPPNTKELETYAATLESELDSFLDGDSALLHEARVVRDGHSAMVEIKLIKQRGSRKKPAVLNADAQASTEFARARALLRRKHSQWVYFDRDLIMFDDDVTYLFKPLQRVHWTRSQAAVDADQIISETLTSRSE